MEKKYILTDETLWHRGHTLHRIKAVKDFGDVKAGDLGGWVESEENLSHEGLCWIADEAEVFGNAFVAGDAQVYENAWVFEKAEVVENARVYGGARVCGEAMIFGFARVYGYSKVYDEARICQQAQIYELARVYEYVWVGGKAKVFGSALVHGFVNLDCAAYIQLITDYLCIGPIGSRGNFTTFYKTEDQGIWVSCGCFNGSIEEFERAVRKRHAGTLHEKEYLNAIRFSISLLGN